MSENENEEYNSALEWAAKWILGSLSPTASKETFEFAENMVMSIRAAKRLTKRAVDVWRAGQLFNCVGCATRN